MSLTKIPASSSSMRAVLGLAVLFIVGTAVLAAKWAVGGALATRSQEREVTEVGASLAPGDPNSRFAYAGVLEQTFDQADISRSLVEYEAAAAISPHDYRFWLGLGRARERDGDRAGAESAYRQALELAPNYSRVNWALGNLLVRMGRGEEGFAHIRTAADAEITFAAPAVAAAWQVFNGDLLQVTAALGESDNTRVELAEYLAGQKRFDESIAIWNAIPRARRAAFSEQGRVLAQKTFENGRFRLSLAVSNDISDTPAQIGAVTNGGFELPIRPKSSGNFDWKNIEGLYPQMGPTGTQKKAGETSLLIRFVDPTNLEFRPLSQTVAVEPGRRYALSVSYRSELKSSAIFGVEILNASSGTRIGLMEPFSPAKDWLTTTTEFTVPADTDGVTLRLMRENCAPPACTVVGNLWLDEFVLSLL